MARKPKIDTVEALYQYGLDLDTRTVWLEGEEVSADSVTTALKGLHLLSQTPGSIRLILNTPGGDVAQGLALYDYIRSLVDHEIIVSVYGEAYSMGAIILQAGDIREISTHSTLMIHDGEAEAIGYNRQTRKAWSDLHSKFDTWTDDILLAALRRKNKEFTRQRLQAWLAKDTIIDAKTALELGLVDRVVGVK